VTPPRQLALDLPARPALGRAEFYVAAPNRLALAQIDRWPDWPDGKLAVVGPPASGKTHLAHVWAGRAAAQIIPASALPAFDLERVADDGAVAVEDADAIPALGFEAARAEEALFHLHNRLALGGGTLMVTGTGRPATWRLRLPDLASRLRACVVAELAPPDDTLLAAILVKLFSDRQLEVSPDVIDYLLPRIERTFAGAQAVVMRLDRVALARRRQVTVRLAAELLAGGAR
jgi:chromosomal replication initiation ATPase DnaA